MQTIFAIDPGPETSGYVFYDPDKETIIQMGAQTPNHHIMDMARTAGVIHDGAVILAVEAVEPFGKMLGNDLMNTILLIGRIQEATMECPIFLVTHKDTKRNLCGTTDVKNKHVREAIEERIGKPGTKKLPGPTFGITDHTRSALAVAITVADILAGRFTQTQPKPKQKKP